MTNEIPQEVEKKYLLKTTFGLEDKLNQGKEISQAYLDLADTEIQSFITAKFPEIQLDKFIEARVRNKAGKCYLTLKGDGTLERNEEEAEISIDEFVIQSEKAIKGSIEKERHEIPLADGLVLEIDMYRGKLTGLYIAEVEFNPDQFSPEQIDKMVEKALPLADAQDVTSVKAFKNKNLATIGSLTELLQELEAVQDVSNVVKGFIHRLLPKPNLKEIEKNLKNFSPEQAAIELKRILLENGIEVQNVECTDEKGEKTFTIIINPNNQR
ncbi:hypothetical protein A2335_00505, partial [Candidatus Peregrinibacteria bacterium RIFOXYB2_FULL_32_7]